MEPRMTRITPRNDPQLRLDILLLRLGEQVTHLLERKAWERYGLPLNLWDGIGGVRSVLESKIEEFQIDRPLSPMMLAEKVGLVKAKPQRIRKAG